MRIIFLEAVQNFGGSKRSVIEISDQLQRIGHEILIVDFWGANNEFKEAVRSKRIAYEVLELRNEPFVISKGNILVRISKAFKYIFKRIIYKRKFKKIVDSFRPDYVCVNSAKTLDILDRKSTYKIDYYARGWTVGGTIKERFTLRKYSPRFIAISEATRHAIYLKNNTPLSSIRILKVAIGETPFVKKPLNIISSFNKDYPISLLHAGTFTRTKGHHISILVAKVLKDKDIHFRMKLAGLISVSDDSKKYYESLKKMVTDKGLENNIEFVVNNHNLIEEMEKSDVFIYPSYTEGLSRVCLEAMSKGKPVVANPVGGITDFVINGYSGYLADFNNINNFANCIIKYYESIHVYQQHSQNAVDIVNSGYLLSDLNEDLNKLYSH